MISLLETRFPWTLSIILVFPFSVLDLHYNLSTCIFSFELLIAHLDEHIIIYFVRPSSFQLSCYSTIYIIAHLINFSPNLAWPSVACHRIVVNLLLIGKLVIDLLKIFVAVAGVLDLLLLLTLKSLFSVWSIVVYYVRTLVTAQAQTYTRDTRHIGNDPRG